MDRSKHIIMHNKDPKKQKFERDIAEQLYLEGYSGRYVAKQLGVGKTVILDYINEAGLARKRTQKISYNKTKIKRSVV